MIMLMGRWQVWVACLIRAAVSGGANSIAAVVAAPDQFNFQHPARLGTMACAGAFIAVAHYLARSPLPDGIGEEREPLRASAASQG